MVLYNSAIVLIKRVKKAKEKLFAAAAVLVGSFFNYCYYHDTYVGEIAYANIPSKIPEKNRIQKTKIDKKRLGYADDSKISFAKEDGSTKEETWSDENVKLPPDG